MSFYEKKMFLLSIKKAWNLLWVSESLVSVLLKTFGNI